MKITKRDKRELQDMETLELELTEYITDCIRFKSRIDEDVLQKLSESYFVSLAKTKKMANRIKKELQQHNSI